MIHAPARKLFKRRPLSIASRQQTESAPDRRVDVHSTHSGLFLLSNRHPRSPPFHFGKTTQSRIWIAASTAPMAFGARRSISPMARA